MDKNRTFNNLQKYNFVYKGNNNNKIYIYTILS